MLGCMRGTCMQNEMHMMTWYEMHMMTWQSATRKHMTWQRRRITGRHLAHRIRGVTHPEVYTLAEASSYYQFSFNKRPSTHCDACQIGKHTTFPFTSSTTQTTFPLSYVIVIYAHAPIPTISDYLYYLVLMISHTIPGLSLFVASPKWRKYALETIIKLLFISLIHDKCLLFMLELY